MNDLIASSTAQFESTFGFTLSSIVDWVMDWLLLIVGTGLAFLQALIPLLVGIALIGAVVGIIWMGFRVWRSGR